VGNSERDFSRRETTFPALSHNVYLPFYSPSPRTSSVMCRSTFTSTRLTLNLPTLPLSVPPSVLEERRNSTLSVLAWTQADEDEMSGSSLAKNPQLVWMLSNEKKNTPFFFLSQKPFFLFISFHPQLFLKHPASKQNKKHFFPETRG